ncbi:TPA: hypothetical protein HA265_03525 [Candidatus Woesearchaeota archaeon]|nr:hypothetical protein [Candidatus Woesearchaeota archaeon]
MRNKYFRKRGAKKAQITIFIIIGVIVLFSAGVYIYLRQTGAGPIKFLQPKTPPVEQYILACMEKTAEDGLRILGAQGGFITFPDSIDANPARYVSLVPGVPADVAPKVPYWYWQGQTELPSLGYMEQQLEGYVDIRLGDCIQNFTQFTEEYIITPLGAWHTDVVFTEKETVVSLDWKIDIQQKGQETTEKDQFIVNLDAQVKRMYELGRELLEAENEKQFYEQMTIDLMASHPESDIPFDGLTLHCGRQVWALSQIKDKLLYSLEPAIMGIRFRNTDHPPWLGTEDEYAKVREAIKSVKESETVVPLVLPKKIPPDSYDYFQYYFNFTNKDYSEFKVTSNFRKEWGMNLYATPNEYGILKSGVQDLKSRIMSFLCLNTFHFVYDVYYPVMISINDPEAFHGGGYVFRYAFPVQIYHNKGDRSIQPPIEFNPTEFDLDYCDAYGEEEHTVRAVDVITNAELSRANLTFRCMTQACVLGTTRTNNVHLQWTGKFPSGCGNPVIEVQREDYLPAYEQHTGQEPFEIKMWPTQEVKFTFLKHLSAAPESWKFLEGDEHIVMSIEHKDPEVSGFYTFTPEETFNSKQTMELLRADATYDVNIMLFKQIGPDEDAMVGGWIGKWEVKYDEIADASKVEFHIIQRVPLPRGDMDFVETYMMMTNQSLFPQVQHVIRRGDSPVQEPAPVPEAPTPATIPTQ